MEGHEQPNIAVYPGTFDPITNGHIDIVARAIRLFNQVIISVSSNSQKRPWFNIDERLIMIRESTRQFPNLTVEAFDGLLVHYVRKKGAIVIIRGIRAVSDFEYEFQMALMNRKLDAQIETIFLTPGEEVSYLSSSLIKEVAQHGGNVSGLVPERVAEKLSGIIVKGGV